MKYNILHIEDSKTDADLVKRIIEKSNLNFSYRLVSDKDETINALNSFEPNIVLCDHTLPSFNSKMAYKLCKEKNAAVTFILVTGTVSEEFAVDMLKAGVDDYLLKANLQRLPSAIENSFLKKENHRKLISMQTVLERSEAQLRTIFDAFSRGLLLMDREADILEFNNTINHYCKIVWGGSLSKGENLIRSVPDLWKNDLKPRFEQALMGRQMEYESVCTTRDDKTMIFCINLSPVKDAFENVTGVCLSIEDITNKKEAEVELKKSENNLRQVLTSNPDIFYAINSDFTITLINETAKNILSRAWGKKVDLGGNLLELIPVNKVEPIEDILRKVLLGERIEYEIHEDVPEWFQVTCSPVFDDEGNINGAYVVSKDITTNKIAEVALIASEKEFRVLAESMPQIVWATRADGWNTYFNQQWVDYTGLSLAESYGHGWNKPFHPDDQQRAWDAWESAVQNREEYVLECRLRKYDDTYHWWLIRGMPQVGDDGEITKWYGTCTDIERIKQSEEIIKKEKELSASVINNLPGVFYVYDENFKMQRWNKQLETVTGYSSAELKAMYVTELFTNADRNYIEETRPEVFSNNCVEVEANFTTKAGKNIPYYFTGINMHYEDRSSVLTIGIDLTERNLAGEQLKQLNESLQRHIRELALSNTELEQFAFVASHDLQEPLRMVTSFLTQLDKKYGDVIDERGKKYIGFAVDGAKRMRQIILDLLEYSRVGQIEDEKGELDLLELLSEVEILLRRKIEEKKAVITIEAMPLIQNYRSPIRQVFLNLIGNALNYSRKDNPVKIQITAKELDDCWQFAVIDNGIGIEKQYFDKIFIIFQRLHGRDHYSGTGIGLAITKKIVNSLGGKIWLESEVNKGSTFYFTVKK